MQIPNDRQQQLPHNEDSHTAANDPPDTSRIPIADPLKAEGKPPPDQHHLVDAGDIPRKVSTSAPTANKKCVEAEVTEISSDKREKVTCNDSHDKSHTNLAEGTKSSAKSLYLRFSNKLKDLSTYFPTSWNQLKLFYNSCRSANGRTILLCVMKLIGLALDLMGWIRIVHGCSQHLSELGYDPSSPWLTVVVAVACFILASRIKLLRKFKTLLWLLDWLSRL